MIFFFLEAKYEIIQLKNVNFEKGRNQAEKEFQSVASRAVFDFRGKSMELIEKTDAKAIYLLRDLNPPNASPKACTSRYIFKERLSK